mgnify:CR=1 FL=1
MRGEFKMEEFNIIGSSVLSRAVYDEKLRILTITFKNGKSYSYYNLPQEIWQAFKEADSKGRFFISNIKGKYIEG